MTRTSIVRSVLSSVAALALVASFVPALASAQYFGTNNCNNGFFNFTNTSDCTAGKLLVYVQVLGQDNTGATRQASDFAVNVAGQNASPSSFPGSLVGTYVTVVGGYSVTAAQLPNYTVSYSTGCTGTVVNNQQATCVITENSSYTSYNSYPIPYQYQYPYNTPSLSCTTQNPVVNLGQTATFVAQGGGASQYNWQTPFRSYLNVGPVLNVSLPSTGVQTITVTNNGQTATCTVNVVANGAPAPTVYQYPNGISGGVVTISGAAPVAYVTPTYIPSLPNTGFEPQDGATIAFAMVALIAAAFISFPYVRKAFAAVLG